MVQAILISDRQMDILNHPDFNDFMEHGRIDDLKRIYSLNKLVMDKEPERGLYDEFKSRWKKWI